MNDPNFEQNRIEYKSTKAAADKALKNGTTIPKKTEQGECSNTDRWTIYSFLFVAASSKPSAPEATSEGSSKDAPKAETGKAFTDFFSAMEEQTTIFNPQTGLYALSPSPFLRFLPVSLPARHLTSSSNKQGTTLSVLLVLPPLQPTPSRTSKYSFNPPVSCNLNSQLCLGLFNSQRILSPGFSPRLPDSFSHK